MNSPTKAQKAIEAAYQLFSNIPDIEIGYSLANNRFQVSGNSTRQFIKELKGLGFWYDGRQKVWYLPQFNRAYILHQAQESQGH